MILTKTLQRLGIDTKKIHPHFEHFDHLVTILVFADLLPKLFEGIRWIAEVATIAVAIIVKLPTRIGA